MESKNSIKISNPSISAAFCGRSKANTVNCVALITSNDESLMLLKMPGNLLVLFYYFLLTIKLFLFIKPFELFSL